MRKLLVRILQFLVVSEAQAIALLLPKKGGADQRRTAVLEPCPSSNGSAGDEALISGVCRFAMEQPGTGTMHVVSFLPHYQGCLPRGAGYGGSLYRGSGFFSRLFSYLAWPLLLRRYDSFYIIGADLIDGYYSSPVTLFLFFLARVGAILGVRMHIVSASFNELPPEDVKNGLRRLPPSVRLHMRDKYSATRVEALTGRTVKHSADVAFGLIPEETPQTAHIAEWMRKQRETGRPVLILNINMLPIYKQYNGKQETYVRQWQAWVGNIVEVGGSVLFISHDYRGPWGDQVAAQKVYDALPQAAREHCHLPEKQLHAAEIKELARKSDLVVTGRMHLAIGALGSGTPVIGYAYQSKFEGIFDLFEQKAMVRSIDGIFNDVGAECLFCREVLARAQARRTTIGKHVEAVLQLARENITT